MARDRRTKPEIEDIEKFAGKTQQPFSAISEQKPYSGRVEPPQRARQRSETPLSLR
jgi:hypothetical protein